MAKKKRRSKESKRRITEILKTVAIVFLTILCGILAYFMFSAQNITDGDRISQLLWSSSDTNLAFSENYDSAGAFWNYTSPNRIVITKSGARELFTSDTEEYKLAYAYVKKVLERVYNENYDASVVGNDSEWNTFLGKDSVYIQLPCAVSSDTYMRFFGLSENNITRNMNSFSQILFSPDGSENGLCVFLRNSDTGMVLRLNTTISSAELASLVKNTVITSKDYSFAYELGLDKTGSKNYGLPSEARLDSMLPVSLATLNTSSITASVPEIFKHSIDVSGSSELSKNMLSLFGYNPNIIRQYLDSKNNLVFVSDSSTLTLSPSGVIDFGVVNANGGLNITNGENTGKSGMPYLSMSGVIRLIDSVNNVCGIHLSDKGTDIRLTDIKALNGKMIFTFDYFVGGYRVKMKNGAFSATVKDGNLIAFTANIKMFEISGQTAPNEPIFTALGNFLKNGKTGVSDSYLCYIFKGNDMNIHTSWEVLPWTSER